MINNAFYEELREDWYDRFDHPVALLRAENAVRIPWIAERLPRRSRILDIGCGAGFLTNALALEHHEVCGVDLSPSSLAVAKRRDATDSVAYFEANAYALPFEEARFDAVCAMDVLEHVEEPDRLIREASRVLKPGGLFFFHTFNRTWLSYLLVIKGVEWCVQNTPPHMHIYSLFLTPNEVASLCDGSGLEIELIQGFSPRFNRSFCKLLASRKVPKDFSFKFSRSLKTGYCGYARKRGSVKP